MKKEWKHIQRLKHLTFEQVFPEKPRKTKIYCIYSSYDNCVLGSIYWRSGWRQYVFEPQTDVVWSDGCLEELLQFMKELRR